MGGANPAPQTFLDRCEQGKRRHRKRRGGGWNSLDNGWIPSEHSKLER